MTEKDLVPGERSAPCKDKFLVCKVGDGQIKIDTFGFQFLVHVS